MPWTTVKEGLAQVRREKSAREQRDIEQAEIAKAVGVTPTTYSRWENGKRNPDESDVRKLAAYFNVTPAYLRYGVEEPPALPPAMAGASVPRLLAEKNKAASDEGGSDKQA